VELLGKKKKLKLKIIIFRIFTEEAACVLSWPKKIKN
jgi:hypothetical protein